MGNLGARGDEYERFVGEAFGRGQELRRKATSCAIFVGACRIRSGWAPKRGWPRVNAITSWAGVPWFGGHGWLPYSSALQLRRGDVLYWSGGGSKRWQDALNGHVGILIAGAGHMWITAEGGGSPGGTMCRMSKAAKDVRTSSGRPLRGVWRPDVMHDSDAAADTEPAPPPAFVPIRYGSKGRRVQEWQLQLLRHGQKLPVFGVDGDFGGETLAATRAFQVAKGLMPTGDVNEETWDAAK